MCTLVMRCNFRSKFSDIITSQSSPSLSLYWTGFSQANDGNMIVTNVYQLILLEGFSTGFQRPIF